MRKVGGGGGTRGGPRRKTPREVCPGVMAACRFCGECGSVVSYPINAVMIAEGSAKPVAARISSPLAMR